MLQCPRHSVIPHLAFAVKAKREAHIQWLSCLLSGSQAPTPNPSVNLRRHYEIRATQRIPRFPRPLPPSSRPPKDHDEEDRKGTLVAGRAGREANVYFWGVCIFAFTLSLYATSNIASHMRAVKATARLDLPQNSDVSNRWRDPSRDFDAEVDLSENLLLLRAKRKRLVNEAYGNVLEVSCGTGRNMDLYDLRPYDPKEDARTGRSRKRIITSLTFNDQSEVMVDHAERKFEQMEEGRKLNERFSGPVRFIVGDAGIKGVIDRPTGGYDTIVQTMGVCSVSEAASLLRRLGELCRQPGEPSVHPLLENDDGRGGKILLLEHGRGRFGLINRFLDDGAKMHAAHYGCWWNKDIVEVIEESGLVVDRMRRYNFGTTWEIVLRPRPTSNPLPP